MKFSIEIKVAQTGAMLKAKTNVEKWKRNEWLKIDKIKCGQKSVASTKKIIIERERDESWARKDFFCRSSYFNLPTTCMSPDTIIVLKCGASAETVKNQQKKIWAKKNCVFLWFYLDEELIMWVILYSYIKFHVFSMSTGLLSIFFIEKLLIELFRDEYFPTTSWSRKNHLAMGTIKIHFHDKFSMHHQATVVIK